MASNAGTGPRVTRLPLDRLRASGFNVPSLPPQDAVPSSDKPRVSPRKPEPKGSPRDVAPSGSFSRNSVGSNSAAQPLIPPLPSGGRPSPRTPGQPPRISPRLSGVSCVSKISSDMPSDLSSEDQHVSPRVFPQNSSDADASLGQSQRSGGSFGRSDKSNTPRDYPSFWSYGGTNSLMSGMSSSRGSRSVRGSVMSRSAMEAERMRLESAEVASNASDSTIQTSVNEFPRSRSGASLAHAVRTSSGPLAHVVVDSSFLVDSDLFCHVVSKIVSVVSLCTAFAMLNLSAQDIAKSSSINGGAVAQGITALLLSMISLAAWIRFRCPVSLHLSRVRGKWSLILQRQGIAPLILELKDLEAFVETFGCRSRWQLGYWGKTAGCITSAHSAVHFFFDQGGSGKSIQVCCSLQDPLAFFTSLRDVLAATSHELTEIATDYVADWIAQEGIHPTNEDGMSLQAGQNDARDLERQNGTN